MSSWVVWLIVAAVLGVAELLTVTLAQIERVTHGISGGVGE